MKYLILFFIISFNLKAATKLLMPTDKLPREFIYLTESLQELQIKESDKIKSNDRFFDELGKTFQLLTKEELFFILKSEIYKTVLRFKPPANVKDKYYEKNIFEEVDQKLKTAKLNSFSHWLILGIKKDVITLMDSRDYPTFLLERKRGAISTAASKKLQKKLGFLLPWLQSFNIEDPGLFEYSLIPVMNKALDSIAIKVGYLLKHSRSNAERKTEQKLVFFEKQTLQINKSGKAVTVEDILDPVLSKLKNQNLPIPVDDWIEDEDDFASGLTPIKVIKPTKDYNPPKQLPAPAEEW